MDVQAVRDAESVAHEAWEARALFVVHNNCHVPDPDNCFSTDCEQIGPPPCHPECLGDGHCDMLTYRDGVERIERHCVHLRASAMELPEGFA